MSETKKTAAFVGVALVIFAIGTYAAWPTPTRDTAPIAGTTLFEGFRDPLAASNLKVVSFDEAKGELEEFVVRKDDNELWTIQSKSDYPADALEQVTKAANSLIGLKVLDVQTSNPEDHDDLGVVEPDVRKLEVGDEGVGRLVTFRDRDRGTLASIIIGDAVKGEDDKRYARIPGQDPVYVVKFDPAVVSTQFQQWIEEDLLQLSSIEIDRVTVDDYEAQLGSGGRFALNRNYIYTVGQTDDGWELIQLARYGDNPLAEPDAIEPPQDQTLATTKLNDMKNALDDLKFVDVFRKPKGIGASLQADADLVQDEETVRSLVTRGFYPVTVGDADQVELMSANGEMRVTTKDGVQYLLRFGNIAGSGDQTAEETDDSSDADDVADREGVNRYLLVTTAVDQSKFPVPDAQPIPKSVEELKQQRAAARAEANPSPSQQEPADQTPPDLNAAEVEPEGEVSVDVDLSEEVDPQQSSSTDTQQIETADIPENADEAMDQIDAPESASVDGDSGSVDVASGRERDGQDEVTGQASAAGAGEGQDDTETDTEASVSDETDNEDSTDTDTDTDTGNDNDAEPELTDIEWEELLEAEQEKITKANQRLLDERRDNIEAAEQKVAQLNQRFADWYYVIPESTYRKLRVSRSDLFETPGTNAPAPTTPNGGPSFNLPGVGN